ncbi:MAG: Mediator of RNA polymerase II transcription subunit 18, partial [Candelina submexicana]
MHELLLFAQVPTSRHDQLLKIIAGIAAMQPQRVLERHLIFKPSRKPGPGGRKAGGSQGVQSSQMQALQGQMHGEMFYMQLVGEMREEDFTTLSVESSQT